MQKLTVVDRCLQVRQQHWRGIFAMLVHWLASEAKFDVTLLAACPGCVYTGPADNVSGGVCIPGPPRHIVNQTCEK